MGWATPLAVFSLAAANCSLDMNCCGHTRLLVLLTFPLGEWTELTEENQLAEETKLTDVIVLQNHMWLFPNVLML